ncbi:MAG: XrtV sorting system accessory protein [Pseudomonadota bacterium]
MKTPYDFVTMALFAAIIVLFLQRSTARDEDPHPIWQYLIASVGCAVTNYIGNEYSAVGAVAMLGVTLAYIIYVLQPFPARR